MLRIINSGCQVMLIINNFEKMSLNIQQDSFEEDSIWATHLKWDNLNGKQQKATAEDDDLNEPKINSDFAFKLDDSSENIDLMQNCQEMPIQYYQNIVQEIESPQLILIKSLDSFRQQPNLFGTQGLKIQEQKLEDLETPKDKANTEEKLQKTEMIKKIQINEKLIMSQGKDLKKMKKNTNIPKFLVRIFMKYFQKIQSEEPSDLAYQFHQQIVESLKMRENNNFKISDVLDLLGNQKDIVGLHNRKVMSKILRRTLKEEVMKNKYIGDHHKKSYLIASKIYALRCQSLALACRVQIH